MREVETGLKVFSQTFMVSELTAVVINDGMRLVLMRDDTRCACRAINRKGGYINPWTPELNATEDRGRRHNLIRIANKPVSHISALDHRYVFSLQGLRSQIAQVDFAPNLLFASIDPALKEKASIAKENVWNSGLI